MTDNLWTWTDIFPVSAAEAENYLLFNTLLFHFTVQTSKTVVTTLISSLYILLSLEKLLKLQN